MSHTNRGVARRGVAALPAMALLTTVSLMIGMGVSARVSGLRPTCRVVRRERLAELVARSALEEVSARLEARGTLTASLPVEATRGAFAAEQVALEPARLTWSRGRGYGILQVQVAMSIPEGNRRVRFTVTARRYFEHKRSAKGRTLRVHSGDIVKVVKRA